MPKIINFSTKAARDRERKRKSRLKKSLKQSYQTKVQKQLRIQQETYGSIHDENDSKSEENIANELSLDTNSIIEMDNSFNIAHELRKWTIKHNIKQMALNDLLSICISAGYTSLPKDSRTLMETPKFVNIYTVGNGKMWYRGIASQLKRVLSKCDSDLAITLDFNFDGLPIFNSSKKQFWPILSHVRGFKFFF